MGSKGKQGANYLARMTMEELCRQYWQCVTPPPETTQGKKLAKVLQREAREELERRLGEEAGARALEEYASGKVPVEAEEKKVVEEEPVRLRKVQVMYIEQKTDGERTLEHRGPAEIGEVAFSRTGMRAYYKGKRFQRIARGGIYGNYRCLEDGNEYWITGVKKRGSNRHRFGGGEVVDGRKQGGG